MVINLFNIHYKFKNSLFYTSRVMFLSPSGDKIPLRSLLEARLLCHPIN